MTIEDEQVPATQRKERRGRPKKVKYPNQPPKKRLKNVRITMSVGDETDRQLDALCAYSGKSKTAVMESLLAYEHARLVMEGKIKA